MGSAYFHNFGIHEQKDKIKTIKDFAIGNTLTHFKKRWIDDRNNHTKNVDYKKRHVSINYLDFVTNAYLAFVEPLKELEGIKGRMTKEKRRKLEKFFYANRWADLCKQIARYRKYYGDVYIYWYIDKDDNIKLKVLESESITVHIDEDENPFSYSYKKTVRYEERSMENNNQYQPKEKNIEWIFEKGKIDIFEDGLYKETVYNRMELNDVLPLIHIQYGFNSESPY